MITDNPGQLQRVLNLDVIRRILEGKSIKKYPTQFQFGRFG